MASTKIEWTNKTWNPVTGCTKVSEGCRHCYAERMAKRLAGRFGYPTDKPFRVTLHPERMELPLQWKKPQRIFVNSMSDLFHPDIPDDFIRDVFSVMQRANWHTFQVLTKRPQKMASYLTFADPAQPVLPNVWVGASAENQKAADERSPLLQITPAAVRFLSLEPLLGPVVIDHLEYSVKYGFKPLINWVIVGGESGPGARPMNPDWVRSIRDQCLAANVPFFFKQWGEWEPETFDIFNPEEIKSDHYKTTSIDIPGAIGYNKKRFKWVGKKRSGRLLDGVEWNQMPNCNQVNIFE